MCPCLAVLTANPISPFPGREDSMLWAHVHRGQSVKDWNGTWGTGAACLEWQQPGVRLCHLNSKLDLASK